MDPRFRNWAAGRLSANSQNSYLSGLRSLEQAYGDLDVLHREGGLAGLFDELTYSAEDERHGRPNPSRVPIQANLGRQLSNLRSHLRFYAQFLDSDTDHPESEPGQCFGLEADLQAALRANLGQLEPGLVVDDGGMERKVASGFIDILARDARGIPVVIELKATPARREVLGQIAAYMSDIAEETGASPRGILVAPDFDAKLVSGARLIAGLSLMTYAINFRFDAVG